MTLSDISQSNAAKLMAKPRIGSAPGPRRNIEAVLSGASVRSWPVDRRSMRSETKMKTTK